MLWPIGSSDATIPGVGFGVWQLLTYGFLHGSWSHIIFNMLALAMFSNLKFIHPVRTTRWRALSLPLAMLRSKFAGCSSRP